MRDPFQMNEVVNIQEDNKLIVIEHLPQFDIKDYELDDEKDYKKYIKDIERCCRNSLEYKNLINYLREHMNMNECSFYENVNNIDTAKIKIHIHHEPFTLYDISDIVVRKRLSNNENMFFSLVAKEIMLLHYSLLVGLIPLSETPHELVHNGYLFVPANKVFGNYQLFVEIYKPYITPELMQTYNNILKYTELYDNITQNRLLEKNLVFIDVSGSYQLPPMEELHLLMNNTISNIREKALLIDGVPRTPDGLEIPVYLSKERRK